MDEIMTVQEVADYLRISRATIWRWCNEGKLQAFKLGRGWRIRRSAMERLTEVLFDPSLGPVEATHEAYPVSDLAPNP